jgi:hypothetical protein
MNTVEDGRLMVALGKNLIALVESMEDCMAKGRLLPCLVLLYSAIDIVASLESGKASGSAFMAWSDKYLLQGTSLACTASDLYGARCGILHILSAESDISRKGTAHRIQYAMGALPREINWSVPQTNLDAMSVPFMSATSSTHFEMGWLTTWMRFCKTTIESRKSLQEQACGSLTWIKMLSRDFLNQLNPN